MRGTHASPGSAFARAEQGFPHQSNGRPLHASLSAGLKDILILAVATRQDQEDDAVLNGSQGMARLTHLVPEWRKRDRSAELSFLILHLKMSGVCAPAVMWLQSMCSSTGVCFSNAQSRQQGKWRRHHRACSCGQAAEVRVWPGS